MLQEFREQHLTWDKANRRIHESVKANASDSKGRKLTVQVLNDGVVEDLTGTSLSLFWKTRNEKNKGLDAFDVVDASQGIFELYYTTGMLSNEGKLRANLVLVDDLGKIVSDAFVIEVSPGIDEEAVESTDSFTALTEALVRVTDLEQNYAPRLNEVTAQLAQTGKQLNSRMETLISLPEGSTTNDARLEDIKVGVDGTVYDSPGEHVRSVSKGEAIQKNAIHADNVRFVTADTQYLDRNLLELGKYYNHGTINIVNGSSACIYPRVRIRSGETYHYKNLYAYFTTIVYDNGAKKALSDRTGVTESGYFTAEDNGHIYVTVNRVAYDQNMQFYLTNTPDFPTSYLYGDYNIEIPRLKNRENKEPNPVDEENEETSITTHQIIVKKDGTGDFSKVVEAVEYAKKANPSRMNQYEIHIYTGTYNMIEEFGGDAWVHSISDSGGQMQGLKLPDFTHLIGHGSVYIDCVLEDEKATPAFAKNVSTINVDKTNTLIGITFRARNTRYVMHDETNNKSKYLERKVEKCRFIHQGTLTNLWNAFKALGGGTGSGGRYDFIDSYFESPHIPFTYHNNEGQESNYMTLDGCVFKGNKVTTAYDIGFGYYRKNTEKFFVTIKNCITEHPIKVYQEAPGVDSDNVFEVYEMNNIVVDDQSA